MTQHETQSQGALANPAAAPDPRPYRFAQRTACPVCGQTEALTLYDEAMTEGQTWRFVDEYFDRRITRDKLGGARYMVVQCSECTLLYHKYVLDDASLDRFYDQDISAAESLAKRERASAPYFAKLIRTAAIPLKLTPASSARDVRVLDFGMGWGHWSIAAKANGCSVWGAELSQERKSFAQRHGIEVIDPFTGEYDGFFDFINTDQVVEHLVEPREMVTRLVELLRPGGILKIFVPDGDDTLRRMKAGNWKPCKDSVQPLEHVQGFTMQSMDRLAREAGLQPVSVGEVFGGLRRIKYSLSRKAIGPSWYFRKN